VFESSIQAYPGIKRFVQETLGCTCPEEVFNKIDYHEESDDISGRKVIVGDRLLIYIITTCRESNVRGVVNSVLKKGVEERDIKGLNQFRLVLVASCPDELCGSAGTPSKVQDIQMIRHTFML
jgi:hypothetical protein